MRSLQKTLVRSMTEADLQVVHSIECASFTTPWSMESFERELRENKLARYHVLEDEGRVVAYVGLWIIVDEAHITNVAVAPEDRRKGYGRTLIAEVLEILRKEGIGQVTLEVRVGNTEAIGLYESMGFKSAGIRPGYYQDTKEDASIMWKTLENQEV